MMFGGKGQIFLGVLCEGLYNMCFIFLYYYYTQFGGYQHLKDSTLYATQRINLDNPSLCKMIETLKTHQLCTDQPHDTSKATKPMHPKAMQLLTSALPAPLSFATVAVPVAPPCTTTPVAVQLVPQAYPLGQHPPPSPVGQENHPCAHPPVPVAAPSVTLGTATVTPSLFTATVDEATGQDVRLQSRPTWQQPPW